MTGPTQRQNDCLTIIRQDVAEKGVAPSYSEMQKRLGVSSKSAVHRLVKGLEERGLIRRIPDRARAIELIAPRLPTAGEMVNMPLSTLEHHLGELSAVLAHKGGVGHLRAMFDRIGARLAGRGR